jgi:Sec-independent protein translocase protein TatA
MVKRKTKLPETIDKVVETLKDAITEISDVTKESSDRVDPKEKNDDIGKMREELIRLSEDDEITQSVAYLKKASKRMISN